MQDKIKILEEIGNSLKKARHEKGYEIEEVSKQLKIRSRYIEALEQGNIKEVESEIYLIGYLKSYSKWLGLNYDDLTSTLKDSTNKFSPPSKLSDSASKAGIKSNRKNFPTKTILIFCLIITVISYAIWHRNYFKDKEIKFNLPFIGKDNLNNTSQADKKTAQSVKKFVLFARKKSKIQIIDKEGNVKSEQLLSKDDAFFISKSKGFAIIIDNENAVEAFTDDKDATFLGSLGKKTTIDSLIQKSQSLK